MSNENENLKNGNRILLKPWDLQIKTLDNGDKVVQITPSLAFNDQFREEMENLGVKEYVKHGAETDVAEEDRDDDMEDDDKDDD